MTEPAILVEGLIKRFGTLTALGGVDFEVPPGTVFGRDEALRIASMSSVFAGALLAATLARFALMVLFTRRAVR